MDVDGQPTIAPLDNNHLLPLLVEATNPLDPVDWGLRHRAFLEEKLLMYGGILLRGFRKIDARGLARFIRATSGDALAYTERSSPRTQVTDNIYTSTDYPPSQHIFLHNENSYQQSWPMKLYFLAYRVADSGGETPIGDCRRIYHRIQPDLRQRLEEKGFRIIRNFNKSMGLTWQEVFGTSNRAEVNAYCRARGIKSEWGEDDNLRTITVRPFPTLRHPKSGDKVWFNHGTFFNVATLDPALRDVLVACLDPENLPTQTFYGDGTPLSEDEVANLIQAYRQEMIVFPWQQNDLLVLDNMLACHGRMPYTGPRKVLVGMAESMSREHAIALSR